MKTRGLVLVAWGCVRTLPANEVSPDAAAFFESKVRPLLAEHCYECHSHEKKIKGGLVLDSRSGWAQGGESGPAIVPGNAEDSLLIQAIRHLDKDLAMPPKKKLSGAEIAVLTEWVRMGAPDPRVAVQMNTASLEDGRKHWAFQPITNPVPPVVPGTSLAPIDAFIQARLTEHQFSPAPLADRATLLRRATYDLTGLPPTADELSTFLADTRSEEAAFTQVIERLLASPAYGEKWARHWLDLAHYSDTTGCSSDWPIDDMWRYRDWVVNAFNRDLAFDHFVTDQIAGDLLAVEAAKTSRPPMANNYREEIIATGFLATSKRFGSDPGAYDHLTIGDTLDTTWKALQGLTVGCARCHDHKFDPIKASDYYALYGIFASSLFPYSGAERNPQASLLVPLTPPDRDASPLEDWVRAMPPPGPGKGPIDRSRSVLASSSGRWSFEDHETSEEVADRKPLNPWISSGSAVIKDGNSPFTHLLPAGVKLVGFEATRPKSEMFRRVRWEDPSADLRSIAIDFRCDQLPGVGPYEFQLVWRPQGGAAREIILARCDGKNLTVSGATPASLAAGSWYHLSLQFSLAAETFTWRLWNQSGQFLVNAPAIPTTASAFREPGDLLLRFSTEAASNLRQPTVRVDNIVAETNALPDVIPTSITQNVTPPTPPEGDEAKRAAEAQEKARLTEREAAFAATLPRKPDTAFAMWEGTPHDVAIQKRGEPDQPGAVVPRRNLLLFGGQPITNPQVESGRRDLARWLLDDANPLTLRVFVNRLWQWHFGRGLVATPNDFGHKGELPTHPELLDHLVQHFRGHGLSIKAMHREIMLSHAYRQGAVSPGDSARRDPENRWLARFSPRRLLAEEVRDSVLFVTGQLDSAGAGYHQPFPPLPQRNWNQHSPYSLTYEAQYQTYEHRKRSLYLPVVRQVADPFLSTFDGADSNQSIATRNETSVPLQALALLNAPFVVTSANALAARALQQSTDLEAIAFLQRQIFGQPAPNDTTTKLASRLHQLVIETGLSRPDALAVITQSLLSSNAFLYVF